MVDVDPNPPADPSMATVNQSPHVVMDRAKAAFTSRDMDDYAVTHTEDVHYLLVHSMMQVSLLVSLSFMDLIASFVFNLRVFLGSE